VPDKIRDVMIPRNRIGPSSQLASFNFLESTMANTFGEAHLLVVTPDCLGVNAKWLPEQEVVCTLDKRRTKFVNRDDTVRELLSIRFSHYQGNQDGVWCREYQVPLLRTTYLALGKRSSGFPTSSNVARCWRTRTRTSTAQRTLS
jgi:hypothetical protein